jgi:3-deoxy-manno-octulosonate cytidylyltransferase (CMP-KDO synthetase)
MRIIAVIPARLESRRLPRKMLREIDGRPLVAWVVEAVRRSPILAEVIVATDSVEIAEACRNLSARLCMTSPEHQSGTERIHEISESIPADVYINVQGDEPLVHPTHIAGLAELIENPRVSVATLKTPASSDEVKSPNSVKVVTDREGRALYFSRSPIPFDRDGLLPPYFKHLGLYAYRKAALESFVRLPESGLERAERLEQLRFLENGIPVYVAETPYDAIGVDTEEDLRRVRAILEKGSAAKPQTRGKSG